MCTVWMDADKVYKKKGKEMIPKTIHYCWFGRGEKPALAKRCIESWKKYCPDYEIVEWNEDNFDLDIMIFVREAYDAKKYAFVSDVVRLWAVLNYGGIYFDTDVEVVRSFDQLLKYKGFIGFETNDFVNTGQCFGAEKNNSIISEMYNHYKNLKFSNGNGTFHLVGCTRVNTEILINHGLNKNGCYQLVDGFAVFPAEYFNPYDDPTGRLTKTENTYSIHWYSKSWMSRGKIIRSKLTKPWHRVQKWMRGKYV